MARRSAFILLASVVTLIALGVVMLASTGGFRSNISVDMFHDVKRQFIWLVTGAVLCIIVSCIDYRFWQRTVWFWYVLSLFLLILCFVPYIGMNINGASRWIGAKAAGLPWLRGQPSDLAKLVGVFVVAHWCATHRSQREHFFQGFLFPLGIVSLLLGLIAIEVDLGTTVLLSTTVLLMIFLAGAKWHYIAGTLLLGLGGLGAAIISIPNRLTRIFAFLDPFEHRYGAGLQQWRSMLAFGSGGTDGMGLGNGRQKMAYLPEAHTDFIFPMIGEELGLWATLGVVLCFMLVIFSALLIAIHAPDRFGKLLGFGMAALLGIQAIINMGVTTSLLPNKGIPLPFVSYGGSNLISSLVAVGILFNIYRHGIHIHSQQFSLSDRDKHLTPGV